MDFQLNFGVILASIFLYFHDFFGIDFRIDFLSIFDRKWLPKWSGELCVREPFSRLFRVLFRRSILRCIWVAPWLTLGSLLAPLGSLLAPFGSLLAPFGSLLGPFGLHFLILVDVGTLLALFGSLLPPFRLLFLIFNTF